MIVEALFRLEDQSAGVGGLLPAGLDLGHVAVIALLAVVGGGGGGGGLLAVALVGEDVAALVEGVEEEVLVPLGAAAEQGAGHDVARDLRDLEREREGVQLVDTLEEEECRECLLFYYQCYTYSYSKSLGAKW